MLERIDGPRDLDGLSFAELAVLAQDCRELIIDTISARGGHLASNLGAVELTLALHRVFDSPHDKLVWDTSNQTYTHKLVTGRREQFHSIRTPGGLSGFAEPRESEHDTLCAGHAGTGLGYALGMSLALQDNYVVAIVGDGALTCGTSYEALNNIVHVRPKRLIVAVNDNGWSISENVGWLPQCTNPRTIWEEIGFRYVGPIDGHDQQALEDGLRAAKEIGAPVILHVLTHKGRGLEAAEKNPSKFHQPGTPSAAAGTATRYTYSQVFAKTLIAMMERDPRIVGITAAMLEGTALGEVKKHFPDRVYDVGIAEEHAIIMAAGMAKAGLRPVVSIYSTFLQRSFDQLIHDVALQSLPVTICIDRAGLVGDDGKTHHGIFDISYTRVVPNMTVAAPRDENELQHLLFTAIESNAPFAIRYPRGMGIGIDLDPEPIALPIGRGEVLRGGGDVVLFAYGSMVPVAMDAAAILKDLGVDCGVVNARFAKPLDTDLLAHVLQMTPRVLTIEEHLVTGGFGAAVLEAVHATGGDASRVRVHAIPDRFVEQAPQAQQRASCGLDADGIIDAVLRHFHDLPRRDAVAMHAGSRERSETSRENVTW
jgi:1-deoxy-D-xylulose-5-phosphate synthase